MTGGAIAGLLAVSIEYAAQLFCLSLAAWRLERLSGRDAFSLVASLSAGVLLLFFVAPTTFLSAVGSLLAGGLVATALLIGAEAATERLRLSLMEILVSAIVALLVFDWATEHAPVTFGTAGHLLAWPLVALSATAGLWQLYSRRGPDALAQRVGSNGAWASRFWRGPISLRGLETGMTLMLLIPSLGLPVTTTGILSATILKQVALAVLVARITNTRSLPTMVSICCALAIARTAAGYSIAGSAGPPLVEATAFMTGVLWLRRSAFRAALDRRYDR